MAEEGAAPPGEQQQYLVDLLVQILSLPSFNDPMRGFIDEKAVLFDSFTEENKHEYVEMHAEFKNLLDSLLAVHLLETDVEVDDFEQRIVDSGLLGDPRLGEAMGPLHAAEDFQAFKEMMVQRHMDMQMQAEANFAAMAAPPPQAAGAPPAPAPGSPSSAPVPRPAPAAAPLAAAPSAQEERAFASAGGAYGRANMPSGGRKPASNEKAAAIRAALCSATRPK